MWILFILFLIITGIVVFTLQPAFGKTPRGKRLERIKKSANYRNGKFQNLNVTPQLTENFFALINKSFFKNKEQKRPLGIIPSVKTDIRSLPVDENVFIWFGHSSYYLQLAGKRILVDPVFSSAASPVPFFNRAFDGSNVFTVSDLPDIDYLIITHDHWDHLDYDTIRELKPRVNKVICSLGTGQHLERWNYDKDIIMEMDWNDHTILNDFFEIYCLPARHFSGRGFAARRSLWVSYLIKTPELSVYIGGDSGYDTHFAEIGERFGGVDFAILENGQYDSGWKHIHMHPAETLQATKDLHAKKLIPVHNGKFAISNHSWSTPLQTISALYENKDFDLLTPMIGEPVYLNNAPHEYSRWWLNVQ